MRARLIFTLLFASAPYLTSAATVSTPEAAQKFKRLGLHLDVKECRTTSFNEGAGRQIRFAESQLDCGDVRLQLESSYPVQALVVQNQIDAETSRVNEVYGASKNPYAGYVSHIAQCSGRKNLWHERQGRKPLLIGRVTERGAWGACGESDQDYWSALSFLETDRALIKVRIITKSSLSRSRFETRARQILKTLKDGP